ncbi:MAG: Fibronectin type domain protein [Acidobacteriales bacterium]|nr:Fibronectin type domain protein [Terriglobales bacterium]
MRRSAIICFTLVFIIGLSFTACGGGSSTGTTPATPTITISPANLSLNFGQFVQLTPTMTDANGVQVFTPTPVYASSSPNVQVTAAGFVCAGTWNSLTTPTVCTPDPTFTSVPSATITVTAGTLSATVPVAVHNRISRVTLTSSGACVSQNLTQQFTAHAFDANNVDITASAGTFSFSSSDSTIATIDAATGIATSKLPGSATISSAINGVFSLPATFIACPPSSIALTPTTVTSASGASQQLTPVVTDTAGNVITGLALTYSSSQPIVASSSSAGLVSTVSAGSTGIVASCSPPTCNGGAAASFAVFSNLVPVTVSGSSSSTVYVTGATANSIVPIDTTTNTVGTAIAIAQVNSVQPTINSMLFNPAGDTAYLGTDQGLIPLNASTNVTGTVVATPGKVLAVSPDGKKVVVADQTATPPKTYVVDATTSTFVTLGISTVSSAASFSADSLKLYLVSKTSATLAVYSAVVPFQTITLSAPANDVTMLTQGSLAYLAGGTANTITARATCNNSVLANPVIVGATPLLIGSTFDSTHVLGVDTNNIYDVTVSNIALPANSACPVTATNALTTKAFPSAIATPKQLIITSGGTRAFVTNNTSNVMAYSTATATTSAIPLLNGGTSTTTGGATLDGLQLYVGALGRNDVHRIDLTTNTDAQQIAVSLKDVNGATVSPDFVAVRPK